MKSNTNHLFTFFVFTVLIVFAQTHLKAQSITWVGPFGSGFGIQDVSDDGNTVVGYSFNQTLNATIASRWTASGGFQELGFLPDRNNSIARAGSSDGNVVVGVSYYYDGSQNHNYAAFRWTGSGGMQAIAPDAISSQAWDVSGDGSVVVGNMILSGDINSKPFRWTANGGLEDLSSIIGYGSVTGASFDGSVIAGNTYDTLSFIYRPFRLIGNTLEIYSTPNSYISVSSVSGDGKVVVGQFGSGTNTYPFRWDTVMQNLQNPEFGYSYALRTNYNGSIIVGYDLGQFNNDKNAWRWTISNGFQNLNIIYSSLLPNNVQLFSAASISSDGRYIAGGAGDGIHTLGSAYILDTQSNLNITEPTIGNKFIAGETGLIKWTGGESGQTIIIEFSTDNGINWDLVSYASATDGQYLWDVPDSILTTKAKIKITDVLNTPTFDESDKFKIKPYILTRIDANGDYYEFRKDRDQWGFFNYQPEIWPNYWADQFNYQGTDPFTGRQYPQTLGAGAFMRSPNRIHPDWVSWVRAFGAAGCYFSVSQARYNENAILKWYDKSENFDGACFGIAAASALAFVNKTEFLNRFPIFPNFNSPSEVHPTQTLNDGVKRVVNELYSHQFGNHSTLNDIASRNKTPSQLVSELKQILKEDNVPIRTLTIFSNDTTRKGAHTILPFKLRQDLVQQNLYYISVYDNSFPLSTIPITVDIFANLGNGSWSYPNYSTWGGNRKIYLEIPPENYLNNAILNKPNKNKSLFSPPEGVLEIGVKQGSNIIISDSLGNKSGYENGFVLENIPGSFPRSYKNGSEDPPYEYYLPINNYSVVLNDFTDAISNTFFFTGNKSMMYERYDAAPWQRDSIHFDGNILVNNSDTDLKEITLLSLINEGTQEKLFTASGLQLLQDNSVKIENPDSNTIKIISYGVDNSYNLELNYVTENEFERFFYSGVSLYPNMTQIFVPEWTNLTVADLKVLIDFESDGIIDDSLSLQNQATDVDDKGSLVSPNEFNLAQNYPNPFNPITKISWQSPVGSHQTIKVYDVLGNEIAALVDEYREAGKYEVEFNAGNLSSGIYFYKLSAGSFTETKKMTVLK